MIADMVRQAMKMHRSAIEELYADVCTVYEYQAVKDEVTKLTSKKETAVFADIPCKLSFESTGTLSKTADAPEQKAQIKVFLAPEHDIRAGSKLVITHNGKTTAYSNASVPKRFVSHQEIELKLFERWA